MSIYNIRYCIFPFLGGVFSIFLGMFVLLKNKKSTVNKNFCFLNVSVSLWLIAYALSYLINTAHISLFLLKLGYTGVILIPVTFYHFVITFLNSKIPKVITRLFDLLGLLFVIFLWETAFFIKLEPFHYFWGYYPKASILHPYFILYFVSLSTLSFTLLYLQIRNKKASPLQAIKIKYVFWGWIIASIATIDFIQNYGVEFYPIGWIFILICMGIIAFAIFKYRLMDIRVAITNTGIFSLVYLFLLGVPFYVGYQTKSWVLAALVAFIFASAGPIIYRLLSKKATDLILARQRHYQHILVEAGKGMAREHNLDKLLKLIVYIVKKAVKIRFAGVFVHNKEKKVYVLKAVRDHKSIGGSLSLTINEDSSLIDYMRKKSSPFSCEEMPQSLRKDLERLIGASFDLVVPSVIKDRVLGFLILGEKLDKSPYTADDIEVFQILARQASLAIENCLFLEEFKKVQQELFQAEKLASIGGMADGVAHQIKNRLNHFSLAGGEIKLAIEDFLKKNPYLAGDEKLKKLFAYLTEIGDSIISNVKRTDGVVRGILNFARTTEKDNFLSYFSLPKVIDTALEYLVIKHEVESIPVEINLNSVDRIWGIESQFSEVIFNLLDNAYEATQQLRGVLSPEEVRGYQPRIKVEAKEEFDSYLIMVSDNGIGIKEEDKPKICAPFFTTKSSYKSGSGIGMYVAKRIIEENHNGKLWFESEYLRGTKFYIKLPKPD